MATFSKTFKVPGKMADHIYQAIAVDIDRFLSKTPLGPVNVERNEATKTVSFKSSMASGTLAAKDGELQVDVTLGLLASAFKGKIEEGVTRWLGKAFGSNS